MAQQLADRIEQFKLEASRAGAKVREFALVQEAVDFIISLAGQYAATEVVMAGPLLAGLTTLHDRLRREGIRVTHAEHCESEGRQQELRDACLGADIGISEATAAIAETGTLVIASNHGGSRLVAVMPRLHITVVDRQNVVASLEEAVLRIKSPGGTFSSPVPTYVTCITGRNTTADIPGALLARAQGPAEEYILLIHF